MGVRLLRPSRIKISTVESGSGRGTAKPFVQTDRLSQSLKTEMRGGSGVSNAKYLARLDVGDAESDRRGLPDILNRLCDSRCVCLVSEFPSSMLAAGFALHMVLSW